MSDEVALGAADGFAFGLSLADAAVDVGACLGVGLGADHDGLMEGAVELSVASAAEAEAGLVLTGGRREWRDAGQAGEGCFGGAAAPV